MAGASGYARELQLQDSWWEPPHLCGGRSASALRENSLYSIMRFSAGNAGGQDAPWQGLQDMRENCKLQDSWWEPPHLCGGRSASALRENSLYSIMRFSAGETTCGKLALVPVALPLEEDSYCRAVSRSRLPRSAWTFGISSLQKYGRCPLPSSRAGNIMFTGGGLSRNRCPVAFACC
jgi:hypothetical protein